MKVDIDIFALIKRMIAMIYSNKDFESLGFLYQAEDLPKNILIEEFCTKHRVDYPTSDTWYRKTHKKVCPVIVNGMPANEEEGIMVEVEKVSEESKVHDPVRHINLNGRDIQLDIMCVHEPIKRILIKICAVFTNLEISDIRQSIILSVIITGLIVVLCLPIVFIMRRCTPFFIGIKQT